ncbi:hypothetical protein J2T31_001413 [Kerstersia gyiorum]|nr:hypothetical protein [Kerstersia gyiorum]MCP1823195.1 hypothetical protein [Kerstersia gyiorum]MCP1826638.1 hypothetical protein [Kerstersia gyiorum]MCW2450813.1 hypothetical protein [Kerstersia gyiorum]
MEPGSRCSSVSGAISARCTLPRRAFGAHGGTGQFQLVVAQRLQHRLRVGDAQAERDAGKLGAVARNDGHQVVGAGQSEPQRTVAERTGVTQVEGDFQFLLHQLLGHGQQPPAVFAELQRPAAAVEQFQSVACFQRLQLAGDRRLADAKLLRGARDIAGAGDGIKRLEFRNEHVYRP